MIITIITVFLWITIPAGYYLFNAKFGKKRESIEKKWVIEKLKKQNFISSDVPKKIIIEIILEFSKIHYKQLTKILFFGYLFFIPPIQRWIMKLPKISKGEKLEGEKNEKI